MNPASIRVSCAVWSAALCGISWIFALSQARTASACMPGEEPWRQALEHQARALDSLAYDFHVDAGVGHRVILADGHYAAAWTSDSLRDGHPREDLSTSLLTSEGNRRHEHCTARDGCYFQWIAEGEKSPGSGWISTNEPWEMRETYLPKMFQQELGGHALSEVLRDWDVAALGDDLIDQRSCLRVRARPPGEEEIFLLWLDVGRDYTPIGIDLLRPIDRLTPWLATLRESGRAPSAVESEGAAYFPLVRWRAEELLEILPGVHLVTRGSVELPTFKNSVPARVAIDVSSLRFDEPAARPAEGLHFPDSCRVFDARTGRMHIEGRPNQESATERELVDGLLAGSGTSAGRAAEVLEQSSREVTESACASNCLFCVLANLGHYVPLSALYRETYATRADGGSLLALRDGLRLADVGATVYRVALADLDRLPLPAIVHIDDRAPTHSRQEGHYVVLWRVEGERVLGSDPPRAPRWIDRSDLAPVWTGNAVAVDSAGARDTSDAGVLRAGAGVASIGLALLAACVWFRGRCAKHADVP